MEKKILIVEDELSLLNVLQEKFENEGFDVLGAKNGKVGLGLALSEKPDLILLDIVMPIMDGITMLKELRKDKWGKDACVIMLTNLNESGKVSESLEKGVHDYLIKTDWSLKDLVKKVKRKLS